MSKGDKMPYYTNKEEAERNAKILELKKTIEKLAIDVAIAQTELEYVRKKLQEAEERNRKLDWLLTEAMEGKL